MADELSGIDFGAIVASIKPSLVTPELGEMSNLSNDKKLRFVAQTIITKMAKNYNATESAKVPRMIVHNGETVEVRHIDIEPLLTGVWPAMSLMLLQLSYGEQMTLIEAIYPAGTQFSAKSFAAAFTHETANTGTAQIELKTDKDIENKLDSANAGIALILAMMSDQGYKQPHPDKIAKEQLNMDQLVQEAYKEAQYRNATRRAKEADLFQDRGL